MRLPVGLACLLFLAGCNTPGPAYRGLAVQRVVVEGSVFDVRRRGLTAQAIRVNPQYAPRFGPIRDRAARAMTLASGCRVISITGDQALAIGRLDCGKGPVVTVPAPLEVDCVPLRGTSIREIGQVRLALDCAPA